MQPLTYLGLCVCKHCNYVCSANEAGPAICMGSVSGFVLQSLSKFPSLQPVLRKMVLTSAAARTSSVYLEAIGDFGFFQLPPGGMTVALFMILQINTFFAWNGSLCGTMLAIQLQYTVIKCF